MQLVYMDTKQKKNKFYLKCKCEVCHKDKSLPFIPYTEEQLNVERTGLKNLFEKLWNKGLELLNFKKELLIQQQH